MSANGPSLVLSVTYQRCGPAAWWMVKVSGSPKLARLSGGTSIIRSKSTRHHLGHPRIAVGDRPEDHGIERRLAVPMIGERLDHDLLVALPFDEPIGPGPGRLARELLALGLHLLGRDDEARGIGKIGEERRDRARSERNSTVPSSTARTASTVSKKNASGNGPVSWNGWSSCSMRSKLKTTASAVKRAAVMEGHVVLQLERVGLAVRADRPAFGQGGLDLERARLVADEPIIDVHQDAKVVGGGGGVRIQRFGLGHLAHDQDAWRSLLGRRLTAEQRKHRARSEFHRAPTIRRSSPPSIALPAQTAHTSVWCNAGQAIWFAWSSQEMCYGVANTACSVSGRKLDGRPGRSRTVSRHLSTTGLAGQTHEMVCNRWSRLPFFGVRCNALLT